MLFRTPFSLILVLASFTQGRGALAQDKEPAPAATPQVQESRPDPTEAGQPGAEHLELAMRMVGQWTTECKVWAAPGAEPVASQGTARCQIAMGGRYIQIDYRGTVTGKPFVGAGLYGFNSASKKYESTWID